MALGPQFHYEKVEGVEGAEAMDGGTYHQVIARHPETGEQMGHLAWDDTSVHGLGTAPAYRRQGVATKMWQHANQLAAQGIAPAPRHSSIRTKEGDAWARSVGGDLPPRHDVE